MKSFSERTGKDKLIELARWIFVPLVALLGVFALPLIAGVVLPPAVLAATCGAVSIYYSEKAKRGRH